MIYSPHIETPTSGSVFNLGQVTITWSLNDPPTDGDPYTDITDTVSYEIEYTDSYRGENDTVWHTIRKRIPWANTSFMWVVGKMIKSNTVRIRMRARASEITSDWSISEQFSINVFDLVAPAIINPVSNFLYTDFILIILDETLTLNTYHQKVRYTLEYASEKLDIEWTPIVTDVPVGTNVIRWNIENVVTSDDYSLKLTAKNSSTCLESTPSQPDQIARSFVYGISIQQSGLFIIDTIPPQALIEIEGDTKVTNQLEQVITIFAEDNITDVDNIRLRECKAETLLSLGEDTDNTPETEECPEITVQKPVNNSAKIQWVFDDKSGLRKIEALLTDIGGNNSLQETVKVFISVFDANDAINDFIIRLETREKIVIGEGDDPTVTVTTIDMEVIYIGTEGGQFWVLEPYPRLIYTFDAGMSIVKLVEFNTSVLIFVYNQSEDSGFVYRYSSDEPTLIHTFTSGLSVVSDAAEYNYNLYIGLQNGELWKYTGLAFSFMSTSTTDPIKSLHGDDKYLYVGFFNNSTMLLYNGTRLTSVEMDAQ